MDIEVKRVSNEEVRPGLWRHYKGGLYTVIGTVTHHETRMPMVLYVSHTYGGVNVRPVHGWEMDPAKANDPQDVDGWLDDVTIRIGPQGTLVSEQQVKTCQRFVFVGDLPSDIRIEERR